MTPPVIDAGRLEAAVPAWSARRPLRLALLGDFGMEAPSSAADAAARSARRPRRIDFDNFDEVIAQAERSLEVALPDGRIAALRLGTLEDLHPDELSRQLPRGSATPEALRAVLMHPALRQRESAWRGVDLLVRELGPGASLEIHLFDLSADELVADLAALDSADDLTQTPLYHWLVRRPSEDADGGYAAIACLHDHAATPDDLSRLARLARIAAHAGAPLFTAMATDALADRRHPPEKAVRAAFAALQARPEAGFLCLAGPRFQLRHAYGRATDRIAAFDFEEFDPRLGLRSICWGHPALVALLAWHRGGDLMLRDRPMQVIRDADGEAVALPCTDRLIRADMAVTLRDYGVQALLAARNESALRLIGLAAVDGTALSRNGPKPVWKAVDESASSPIQIPTPTPAPAPVPPSWPEPMEAPRHDAAQDLAPTMAHDAVSTRSDDASSRAVDGGALEGNLMPRPAPLAQAQAASVSAGTSAVGEDADTRAPAEDEVDAELAALLKSLE
ncbi:type VI secretion system contractile sheath large subunit [Roseateles amylovorans]|uniref:Type VI secretion system contractile sheath large subunit n=1 Tax=Roseateles amylovorans TaxID=2978473 RepID=A0ABY6AU90_9BURK|nr:type VI secretion system contractile sheath large subunit [Roseateles amylovorans]UXH76140.1 type VI secretion system contractile sheath large subunit [Roseateles amylovorans]